jgi:hypothetical protein
LNNPQRPLQQDRHVSSSNLNAPQSERAASPLFKRPTKHDPDFDSDDTFGFNDDEFLALADIAADIGRPIGHDDIGRSIDQETTLSTTTHELRKFETDTQPSDQQHQGFMKPANEATRVSSRDELIAAALQAEDDNTSTGKANSDQKPTSVSTHAVANTPRQTHPQQPSAIPTAVRTTVSSLSTPLADLGGGVQQPPSMAQRFYRNYVKQHRNEIKNPTDQNQKQQHNGSISATKSTRLPSMGGGFNFNSGMVRRGKRHSAES